MLLGYVEAFLHSGMPKRTGILYKGFSGNNVENNHTTCKNNTSKKTRKSDVCIYTYVYMHV